MVTFAVAKSPPNAYPLPRVYCGNPGRHTETQVVACRVSTSVYTLLAGTWVRGSGEVLRVRTTLSGSSLIVCGASRGAVDNAAAKQCSVIAKPTNRMQLFEMPTCRALIWPESAVQRQISPATSPEPQPRLSVRSPGSIS